MPNSAAVNPLNLPFFFQYLQITPYGNRRRIKEIAQLLNKNTIFLNNEFFYYLLPFFRKNDFSPGYRYRANKKV